MQGEKAFVFCIIIFLFILGNILVLRFSLIIAMVISESMSPTLEIGDRVLAIRYWPAHWLRKRQIVLIKPPVGYRVQQFEPYDVIPLIKRIVGLPGDTYIDNCNSTSQSMNEYLHTKEFTIPPRHFVVRGDLEIAGLAPESIGPVPFDNFLALVVMKLPQRDQKTKKARPEYH